MADLFESFSIAQILTIAIGLLLAFKGAISFIDYFKDLYDKKFKKDHEKLNKEERFEQHYQKCEQQRKETLDLCTSLCSDIEKKIDGLTNTVDNKFETLDQRIDNIDDRLNDLSTSVKNLTISDMHDIKQAITKDYHTFVERKGWIDDFNLNCLEHRFEDYVNEGGNSFVAGMMKELRALPRSAPE